MSMVTAADAAHQLGVTRRRVAELWGEGFLRGTKTSAGLSIELTSVHERLSIGAVPGRPWSEDVVWGIITTLSGDDEHLSLDVGRRIFRHDHEILGKRISASIVTARFEARNRDAVRRALALTGESALDRLQSDVDVRVLDQLRGQPIRGYAREPFGVLLEQHDLVEAVTGDIIVHGFRSGQTRIEGETPIALIAADCLRSTTTRVRRVGLDALKRMRDEWLAKLT